MGFLQSCVSNANWDLVHLMSKRGDTGTGGIAYLGVVCSPDFGVGFSSAMDNQSNFPVIPPNFTWNLYVVAHELGHNFGANHTHWCGWPGGPDHPDEPAGSNGTIHDCFDSEGGCVEPVINEQGTIMSYCHLQPAGAILEFHPVVEQAAFVPHHQRQRVLSWKLRVHRNLLRFLWVHRPHCLQLQPRRHSGRWLLWGG